MMNITQIYLDVGIYLALVTLLSRIVWCMLNWKETKVKDMIIGAVSLTFMAFFVGPLLLVLSPIFITVIAIFKYTK